MILTRSNSCRLWIHAPSFPFPTSAAEERGTHFRDSRQQQCVGDDPSYSINRPADPVEG